MKQFLVILMVFTLVSCEYLEYAEDDMMDKALEDTYCNMPLYFTNYTGIDDISDISDWLQYRIDYRECDDVYTPEEVLTQGWGDCDGFTLAWMNIAFIRFGIKTSIVFVDDDEARKVVKGGDINHVVVQLPNGVQIEPQTGWVCDYPIRYIFSFNTVFRVGR